MELPTVAVQHPDDPSERILVNEDDAPAYRPWVEPEADPAPATKEGDSASESDAKPTRRACR